MEEIKSRILIKNVKGATIAHLYNRESFELLNIKKEEYDGSQFIEIGQVIEYDGNKYQVESINFKFLKEPTDMENGYGINLNSPTVPSNYNTQICFFVKNL